jgi:receptor protein-tyrosine kinase
VQDVQLASGASIGLLASGPLPPNPAELLGTTRVSELLAALRADNDYVLIDAPPVLPVTDAVVLSSRVDGIVLVATAKVTGRRDLGKAIATFDATDAPLLGVVVNGAESTSGYAYSYYYRSHSEDGASNGSRERPRNRIRA